MSQTASIQPQETTPANAGHETHPLSLTPESLEAAHAILHANSSSYQYLIDRITAPRRALGTGETLKRVADAASFTCRFHTGRFADGALENLVLAIGRATGPTDRPVRERAPGGKLNVLHVATSVIAIGGHTRMMHRWIAQDHGNCHSLALTRQGRGAIPTWLSDEIASTGGHVLTFGELTSDCERAARLRIEAHDYADLVVVHHAGTDVIPTLAFAADGGPPVAILNHADHLFWLGSSVADLCIDLRSVSSVHSIARRHIPNTVLLPIPLPAPVDGIDRTAARYKLGIGNDIVMLLTVARAVKFRPCGGQDFMATVETVLDEDQKIHLYVVGETAQGMARQLGRKLHPRIHCVGPIEDPAQYRAASDIYVESFPFGSSTSLLEAALDGLPVVPACRPLSKLLVASNDSLLDSMTNPADEAEYCERIRTFIRDPQAGQAYGRKLRHELMRYHVGVMWRSHLQGVYQAAAKLTHQPRSIPVTRCETMPSDIGLGLFSAVPDGQSGSRGAPRPELAALRHAAFVAKDAQDFRVARSLSFAALRTDLFGRDTWRLFLIILLGPLARAAGEALRRNRQRKAA